MEIKNKKPTTPNNKTSDTLSALILICGIGLLFGLLVYGSFELNKKNKIIITPTTKPVESLKPPEPSYFGNEFIQVKIPQKNSAIKNPVIVEGKANVFEANVRIKIKDDSGNILADTFATAEGAYDKLYPFNTEINYDAPATQKGIIEVFEESAKDGGEINKVVIPVKFEDYLSMDRTTQIKLYFCSEDNLKQNGTCECSNEVIRVVLKGEMEDLAKTSINELIKGPNKEEKAQGLFGAIASEDSVKKFKQSALNGNNSDDVGWGFGKASDWGDKVELKSLKIENGIANVNLSKEAIGNGNIGTSYGGCMFDSSIIKTLKQLSEIKSVKIFIEGRPVESFA